MGFRRLIIFVLLIPLLLFWIVANKGKERLLSTKSNPEEIRSQYETSNSVEKVTMQPDENLQIQVEQLLYALQVTKESESERRLDKFTTRYAKKMANVTHQCKKVWVWGGHTQRDGYQPGTKRVCLDDPYKPAPKNCLVYSFGINEEWSFDKKAEAYGCEVYGFDPSMKRKTSNYTEHIHFYRIGLSDTTKTVEVNGKLWRMMGYQDILRMLGHENRIVDILKVDIERSEWDALPQMLLDGSFDNVKQLLVELHNADNPYTHYLTMEAMETYGLKIFHYREVRCTPTDLLPCAEVAYVNTKFINGMSTL